MNQPAINDEQFEAYLSEVCRDGIVADHGRLKSDMVAQFRDDREWAREYAVNAADAGATYCVFSGEEHDGDVTITVSDNGCGMDRRGIREFMTVYRSYDNPSADASKIGTHGIGKLAVAAIPEQTGFCIRSSTGTECWEMKTGNLLADVPMVFHAVTPVPPAGTQFRISFRKRASLREELLAIKQILWRFVRFLPLQLVVKIPSSKEPSSPVEDDWVHGDWRVGELHMAHRYEFDIRPYHFEVILSVGTQQAELYQNRVFITDTYDLLSQGYRKTWNIANLNIRVDSQSFELPFGRHQLRNEDILPLLAGHLREILVPLYGRWLCNQLETGIHPDSDAPIQKIEELLCSLLAHDSTAPRAWCRAPLFKTVRNARMSLEEIREALKKQGQLLIEEGSEAGVDYDAVKAVVLAREQIAGGLDFITTEFADDLVCLGQADAVLEAACTEELTPIEKRFETFLRFSSEALNKSHELQQSNTDRSASRTTLDPDELARFIGLCEEARLSRIDLEAISWRVGRLVCGDGRTPCRTHHFLLKNETVVLNLHHPEIARLVELSKTAPALAGHWGLALCLAQPQTILPHLTPEAREDLILADAISKCGLLPETPPERQDRWPSPGDREWRDFLRGNLD